MNRKKKIEDGTLKFSCDFGSQDEPENVSPIGETVRDN